MDVEQEGDKLHLTAQSHIDILASIPLLTGTTLDDVLVAVMFEDIGTPEAPMQRSAAVGTADLSAPPGFMANMALSTQGSIGCILIAYTTRPLDDPEVGEYLANEARIVIRGGGKVYNGYHVTPEGWYAYADKATGPASDLLDPIMQNYDHVKDSIPTNDYSGDASIIESNRPGLINELLAATMFVIGKKDEEHLFDTEYVLSLFERVFTAEWDDLTDEELARWLVLTEVPRYRDLALLVMASSAESIGVETANRHLADEPDPLPEHALSVGIGMRPPHARMLHVIENMRRMAGVVHGSSWLIVPMFFAAWCSWANGNSRLGYQLIQPALHELHTMMLATPDADPETIHHFGMVHAFSHALTSGIVPPWVFDKEL